MRLFVFLTILFLSDARKLTEKENIMLKSECGQIFDPKTATFPPFLYMVQYFTNFIHSHDNRFPGVFISNWHIVVQASNLLKGVTCSPTNPGSNDAELENAFGRKEFYVATKQCYHDDSYCDGTFKKLEGDSQFALIGSCNSNGSYEGVMVFSTNRHESPVCLPHKSRVKATAFPNDEAAVYSGQFQTRDDKFYQPNITKFYPYRDRYVTPAFDNTGSPVISEDEGQGYLIGFMPGNATSRVDIDGVIKGGYRMDDVMNVNLEALCNFTGACPLDQQLPFKITKLDYGQNLDLKTTCGKIYDPVNTDALFPSWLYSVEFKSNHTTNRVSGVLLSHKHIMVQAQILLKGVDCNSTDTEKNSVEAHIMRFYHSGSIQVAKAQCVGADHKGCKFTNPSGMRFFGKCQSPENKFRGVLVLETKESFDATPICLPREDYYADPEYILPGGIGTVTSGKFPRIASDGNGKYEVNKYPYRFSHGMSYSTNSPSIGTGGALINDFEGRTYFLGFAPADKSIVDQEDGGIMMQEYASQFLQDLCEEFGLCPISNFKPESLITTTLAPINTVPVKPSTKKPKQRKPKKNKNGKEQLPFEYDQEDFIYWPEETTKTADWKGTVWVTVAVAVTFLFS